MTPSVQLAVMPAYSTWHDSGGGHAKKSMPPPPGATPSGNPPSNFTVQCPAAPTSAPTDGLAPFSFGYKNPIPIDYAKLDYEYL
jgi:hypothetical protein